MNQRVILFIMLVLDNAYVHINVKSKKINVELPKLLLNTVLNPRPSTKPKANIQSKLGQSIPIVSHNIKLPKKISNTCIAGVLKPKTGGMNLPTKHKATQSGIIIHLNILLSFKAIIIFSSLKYHL